MYCIVVVCCLVQFRMVESSPLAGCSAISVKEPVPRFIVYMYSSRKSLPGSFKNDQSVFVV
jgi:hypothetical protein